ncbi:hypothetical protein LJB63_26385, partial [[Eubacterium] rectale]|nr:hypothetical protein [Agathobacter rectalis]
EDTEKSGIGSIKCCSVAGVGFVAATGDWMFGRGAGVGAVAEEINVLGSCCEAGSEEEAGAAVASGAPSNAMIISLMLAS